jgi:hypothetical protein
LEHIRDETINNLTKKKVVCPSAISNVGIIREDQNDQVSTQGFPMFSRNEYNNENNESLSANENNVASLLNLKDICRREALPVGCSNWCRKEM